jgi:uncharacterized protein (TIGR03437 family)
MRILLLILVSALPLAATRNGLPVGRTGGFGEPTCAGAGCHRPEPSRVGQAASARLEVGAYVPGASQLVRVVVRAFGTNRWGFQLTARRRNDPSLPVGTFETINQFVAVRCPDGKFSENCAAGEPRYVTHTEVGSNPLGGQAGERTYSVNWTPPSTDVGPIDFAVSALAADGFGSTNDDLTVTATSVSLYAPTNSPMIRTGNGILHAGAVNRFNQGIAPKQLISIFGTNLSAPGTAVSVSTADFDDEGKLPTQLVRLSVEFVTPGDPFVRLGRLIYVDENQINLQTPEFPTGAGRVVRVQVVINRESESEVRGNVIEILTQRQAAGLFTFGNGSNGYTQGEGPAAAVNTAARQLIAPANAGIAGAVLARPGQIVSLFGAGFGPTSEEPGEKASDATGISGVSATIGGMVATVHYAGTAPNFVGLQQFNLEVPNLAPGNHAVAIRSDSFTTQPAVFLPVGP